MNLTENQISQIILDTSILIHRKLGPGLFESVYEEILFYELKKRKLQVERQVVIPVFYEELKMEKGFRADLIINNKVIVEIKSVEKLLPLHKTQLLTYIRLTNKKLGLLINFNVPVLLEGYKRVVNKL